MSRFDYRDFLRSPDGRLASGPPLLNTEGLQYLVGNDGRNAIDQLGFVVPTVEVCDVTAVDMDGSTGYIKIDPLPIRNKLVYEADVELPVAIDGTVFFGSHSVTSTQAIASICYKSGTSARCLIRCGKLGSAGYVQASLVSAPHAVAFDGKVHPVKLTIDFVAKTAVLQIDDIISAPFAFNGEMRKDAVVDALGMQTTGMPISKFHIGTQSNVRFTVDGSKIFYPLQEGGGLKVRSSEQINEQLVGELIGGCAWTTVDNITSHDAKIGCVKVEDYGDTIEVCKYYDNRKMPVIWTSDDMNDLDDGSGGGLERWQSFIKNYNLCKTNHICFTPAIICGKMQNWSLLQPLIDDADHFFPVCHSWSHPWNVDNVDYDLEYTHALQTLIAELDYPEKNTYKAQAYNAFYVQWGWGGSGVVDTERGFDLLLKENVLGFRSTAAAKYDPAFLTSQECFGEHRFNSGDYFKNSDANWIHPRIQAFQVLDGTTGDNGYAITDPNYGFDACYSEGKSYLYYGHAWLDNQLVDGVNQTKWEEFCAYIGNRHDVWYTNPVDWLTYRLMQWVGKCAVKLDVVSEDIISYEMSANSADRTRWGMSIPLTVKLKKPSTWTGATVYACEWYDESDSTWKSLTAKTSTDWYQGIECYRDETASVIISKALPQTLDSVKVRIRKV